MPVPAWLQRFAAGLLLLAVGWSAGLCPLVAYRCDCGPAPRLVASPECIGTDCHPGRGHADGCHDDDASEHASEHAHRHPAVGQASDATLPAAGLAAVGEHLLPPPVLRPTPWPATAWSEIRGVLTVSPPVRRPPRQHCLSMVQLI